MTHLMKTCARLLALLVVPAATTACHDAYDSLFLDPDRSQTARIEYLFTQGLIDADFPIQYGEWYWQVYHNVATWAQLSGTVNDVNMMRPLSDQWQNTWTDYYTKAAMDLKEIGVLYAALPADEKARIAAIEKFRELVDVRNKADGMVHSVEKTLKDLGDKVDAAERGRFLRRAGVRSGP